MARRERLEALLRSRFPQAEFELFDDSAEHAGHLHHAGMDSETHFRLRIRAAEFRGMPLLKIHREILAAIKPETASGLHSFVIEKAEPR